MLDSIPTETVHHKVFRLATQVSVTEFLESQGLDAQGAEEVRELLRSRGLEEPPEALCDAVFWEKPRLCKLGHRTRFSDGSFPVFYSSLDCRTVEAEVRHWIPRIVGDPEQQRRLYYSRFACDFNGTAKDLRTKAPYWPGLLHVDDYGFCNGLGEEAVKLSLGGFLTPSVRRQSGTNLPVFKREAISNFREVVPFAITYNPATRDVSLSPLESLA